MKEQQELFSSGSIEVQSPDWSGTSADRIIPVEEYRERLAAMFDFFPLYDLRGKTSLSEHRGFELGICLLLFIMEKMLAHQHCTYEDCEQFLFRLLPLLSESPPEHEERVRLAQKLIEEISNRGRPFIYSYYDPFSKTEHEVKFRLIEQRPLTLYGTDTLALRLTEKGLEILFKSREIYRDLHFSVMQLYLDQQIRRGVFEGAIKTVNELEIAVEGIENECRRQRENVRRNVIDALKSDQYSRLSSRMEEQLQQEQEVFDNLKELVRETRQRLEKEDSGVESGARLAKIMELNGALFRVASRHLELIGSRVDLEGLVSSVLSESIYAGMLVRFHLKKELQDSVLRSNPPGAVLKSVILDPLALPKAPRLLGLETLLAPQRLLGKERERPPEEFGDEPDYEVWERIRQRNEKQMAETVALLQRFFLVMLERLTEHDRVSVSDLVGELFSGSSDHAEVAAFAHLMLLLHQGRGMQASLPWAYKPGDEDLVEYAFYRLLVDRKAISGSNWIRVEAGTGSVKLPHGIEMKNLFLVRSDRNGLQSQNDNYSP